MGFDVQNAIVEHSQPLICITLHNYYKKKTTMSIVKLKTWQIQTKTCVQLFEYDVLSGYLALALGLLLIVVLTMKLSFLV